MASNATSKYLSYKWSIFITMYVGYTLYMMNRKCFSFTAATIMTDRSLDKNDLGLIASSQNMAYTFSKFLGGLVSDHISPRSLFIGGLLCSGLVTTLFPVFDSVWMFALLWFICGIVQGGGWPACAKLLRNWYLESELGTAWSLLSTSMNLACSVGPLLTTFLLTIFSWESCFIICGSMSIGMVAICALILVNAPEDVDIVGVETMANVGAQKDGGKGRGRGTWQDLIKSRLMWTISTGYFVIFMFRTAISDWGQLYLMQDLGVSGVAGSVFVSSLEFGGIFGSILAGYLGDKAVEMTKRVNTRGTPRWLVLILFIFVCLISLHLFLFHITTESSQLVTNLVGFLMGASIYGPIALYGVMAMESAPGHLSGTSNALAALAANVGAVCAGLPFSYLAKQYEWWGAFFSLEVLIAAVLVMKVLTHNIEYKMVPIKKKMH